MTGRFVARLRRDSGWRVGVNCSSSTFSARELPIAGSPGIIVSSVNVSSMSGLRSAGRDEAVPEFADALDAADELVAGGEPARRGASQAHPGRGAGEDDVTRQQGQRF